MKASLGKLRRFALNKIDAREKGEILPTAQLDELAQAAKEMQDMRDCYDSLLSAAAATANSAYEFSESLREMGSCLLEKTALHDDDESAAILLMLGKVQLELQKLVDRYRAHILVTITKPSESLLNELRTVEDMKRQCDEKRDVYEYMVSQQKEKGRSKSGKGEIFTAHQLRTAHDEFNEDATFCIFRLKSLKQGQSRSLLTQAVRHHAAQLDLFHKGLKSLEAVDQQVKTVAEQQHIDYVFSGLGKDVEDENDSENAPDANTDGELSFDYIIDEQRFHFSSASRNSMEADKVHPSFPCSCRVEEANEDKNEEPLASGRGHRSSSHSAPLLLERRSELSDKVRQLQQSASRRSNTYVLPLPTDSKGVGAPKVGSVASNAKLTNHTVRNHNIWHSSPLDQVKSGKDPGELQFSETSALKSQSVSKETNSANLSTPLPPPLVEGLHISRSDTSHGSDTQVFKRHSLSGPITSKLSTGKPLSPPEMSHGGLPRLPVPQRSTSPTASPSLVSSPKVSELHELPRPPVNIPPRRAKSPGLVGHSAPLVSWSQDHSSTNHSVTNKNPFASTSTAAPLPTPPGMVVPRSFSIPSRNQRAMDVHVSKLLESPRVPERSGGFASPPLTPISFANLKSTLTLPEVTAETGQMRGGR